MLIGHDAVRGMSNDDLVGSRAYYDAAFTGLVPVIIVSVAQDVEVRVTRKTGGYDAGEIISVGKLSIVSRKTRTRNGYIIVKPIFDRS